MTELTNKTCSDAFGLIRSAERMDTSTSKNFLRKLYAYKDAVEIYAINYDFQHASYYAYVAAQLQKEDGINKDGKKMMYQKALQYYEQYKATDDGYVTTMRSLDDIDVLRESDIRHINQEIIRLTEKIDAARRRALSRDSSDDRMEELEREQRRRELRREMRCVQYCGWCPVL